VQVLLPPTRSTCTSAGSGAPSGRRGSSARFGGSAIPWRRSRRPPLAFDRDRLVRRWRTTTAAATAGLVVCAVGATGALVAVGPGDAWWACALVAAAASAVAVPLARRAQRPAKMFLAQQDRLIASALHELQGPLAQLRAVAESPLGRGEEVDDPYAALHQVVTIAGDAGHTIYDLFDLALLASGAQDIEREALRLDEVVQEAITERLGSMALQGQAVHLDMEPVTVLGHRGLLRRAVVNLVLNAIRHGRHRATRPTVTVTVRQDHLCVTDDGPGIEEATLARYLAAVNSGTHTEGLGLGLTIVGWVAALHEGTVTAANRQGGGLGVTVHLGTGDKAPRRRGAWWRVRWWRRWRRWRRARAQARESSSSRLS
jgi:signal transduction histidine kinase